jgi:hypothetical protein
MKHSTLHMLINVSGLALAVLMAAFAAPQAEPGYAVTGHAGGRVWVEGGDVFPAYSDVSIYVRADSDCYAMLLLVDTNGYVHVLYPSSPYDRAWFHGGRTYHYNACSLGLDRLEGVGIAHIYAVGSPVPFDYSYYGAAVFVGGFGFRVYGDPYVACHDFYVSLLPASCRWDMVSVSCARFYVRQWVRYPTYLCTPDYGLHVRIGDSCRECAAVYAAYRCNVSNPYEVLRPAAPKFKREYAGARTVNSAGRVARVESRAGGDRYIEVRNRDAERVKVVSTSRSRELARTTVRVSDRRFKAGDSARPEAGAPASRGEKAAKGARPEGRGSAKAPANQKGATRVRKAQ